MKPNLKVNIGLLLLTVFFVGLNSCKKVFTDTPLSEVSLSNNYRNISDANAAVFGVYGEFLGIGEQYIVLNELRGDLMDVTPNADHWLQEISQHHVTIGNPWADPRPFYKIINDCNDVLANLNVMLAANRITSADYAYRYSDVGCLRSFLYLQLGIHFGSIPYVTDPIADVNALKDASKFPKLAFPDLLAKLIAFTSALPYLQPYPNVITLINGSSTITSPTQPILDGFNFTNYFISKDVLLGDLYLWNGAYNPADYTNAAKWYKNRLELPVNNPAVIPGANLYPFIAYRLPFGNVAGDPGFTIQFLRYRDQDINAFQSSNAQGWRSMFARAEYPTYDNFLNTEWMWQMNYPQNALPVDPFLDLFSPSGGRYLVQPSQTAINNWNSQQQTTGSAGFSTGFLSDFRGRVTYNDPTNQYLTFNNQNVIMKYLYTYQDPTVLQANKYGRFFLYRTGGVVLHFAEAANRDGRTRLAYALINQGIQTVFNPYNYSLTPTNFGNGPALPPTTALGTVPNGDVTNIEQTFDTPPYDFGARNGQTPQFREDWYQEIGTRTRAKLTNLDINYYTNNANFKDLEDQLLLEQGLELAYEGERWPDLLRIALRRNDPTIISNKIFDKLSKDGYGGAATAQATLAAGGTNLYLPFNW